VPDLFPTDTPTPAALREAAVREIAQAMAVGMAAANARTAEAAAWLAAGLPATELDRPAAGEVGAA
jgi:hypothetical protein